MNTCFIDRTRLESPGVRQFTVEKWRKIAEFIDTHLGMPLTVVDLAARVGLSPSHFSRAFSATLSFPEKPAQKAFGGRSSGHHGKPLVQQMRAVLIVLESNKGLCDLQWNIENVVHPGLIPARGKLGFLHVLADGGEGLW